MNKEEPSLPNIVASAVAVTGGLVIMVVIAAIAYLPNRPDTVARPGMSSEERRQVLEEKQTRSEREMTRYGWINRGDGRVRLPIDRAMELAVHEIEREGRIVFPEFDDIEEEATAEPQADPMEAEGTPEEGPEAEDEEAEVEETPEPEDAGEDNNRENG